MSRSRGIKTVIKVSLGEASFKTRFTVNCAAKYLQANRQSVYVHTMRHAERASYTWAIYERFRDKELRIKHYINLSVHFNVYFCIPR